MKARRYVRIARHRVAVDARQYEILEAIAKVKDEGHEPRTVAEMYAMAIGEFVMADLRRLGGRSGKFPALLPRGAELMQKLLDGGLFSRKVSQGTAPRARQWIRDVDQQMKNARRENHRA